MHLRNQIGIILIVLLSGIIISGCSEEYPEIERESKIPADIGKITPETDIYPPILHSDEYEEPVPLAVINTAGAEDSPFIPVGRDELYFVFVPDVRLPVQEQIIDGVTGIYVSKKINGAWQTPERVFLQKPGKLALDGCTFVLGDTMWFCSAREGYTGMHWFTADFVDREWTNWKNGDFNPEYEVGELHFSGDANEVYFHSPRAGGMGQNDIWVSRKVGSEWQKPENVQVVNSEDNEGMPYLTPDENELWFNRQYLGTPAVFRSKKVNNEWQKPDLIISQFAGEPTLDEQGNIYFVHHYYKDNQMIEADIYIAYRKSLN
jgi:hypothetical protein